MGLKTGRALCPYHLIDIIIESEVRPTGVQLKRKAKLPIMIRLTTKHTVFIMGNCFKKLH